MFLEERGIIKEEELENEGKIEAQKNIIENLRKQIDILKSSCM